MQCTRFRHKSPERNDTMNSFRKITALLISVLLISSCFVFSAAAEGSGTEVSPYLISDAAGLIALMNKINATTTEAQQTTADEFYRITNDIDLTGVDFVPGGCVDNYVIKGFAGTLEGDNHTITGLTVDSEGKFAGLFGIVYGGAVRNLNLEGVSISGTSYVGGIAGYVINADPDAPVSIVGCHVDGSVSGTKYVGGIVGMAEARGASVLITDCSSAATINASDKAAGGIAGAASAFDATVDFCDCINEGDVSAELGAVGGIVGDTEKIVDATTVETDEGLKGVLTGAGVGIRNCVNVGIVDDGTTCGGIAGLVGVPYDLGAPNVVIVTIANSFTVDENGVLVPDTTVPGLSISDSAAVDSLAKVELASDSAIEIVDNEIANTLYITYFNVYDLVSHLAAGEGFVKLDDFDVDSENAMADLNAMMAYIVEMGFAD